MKIFKKIFALMLVCLLAVCVLASCGEKKDNDKDEHTHASTSTEWLVDKENHWKTCDDDGEKINLGKHNFEENVCTMCGVHITEYDDEMAELCFYDENDNWIRLITVDGEGNIVNETAEYTYDSDGNMLTMKTYLDGRLNTESEFAIDESGYSYEIKTVVYAEDGSKNVVEYNSRGDMVKEATYKADGTVENETVIEYTYFEDSVKETEKHTFNGKLLKEIKYIVASQDSWGGKIYYQQVTTYNEDGTTTVQTYNENGDLISE